jgi:hypothetical protein
MESVMTDRIAERRQASRRRRVEDHGVVALRIRPGHPAVVVDVSNGGALIETPRRLLPGHAVELIMETGTNKIAVRGHVLRSSVACVRPMSISYRAAIGFERALAWYADGSCDDPQSAAGEKRAGIGFRADATPQVV